METLFLRDVLLAFSPSFRWGKQKIIFPSGILILAGLLGLSLIDIRPGSLKPYLMAMAVALPVIGGLIRIFADGCRGLSRTAWVVVTIGAGVLLAWWFGWRYSLWAVTSLGCLIIGLWSSVRIEPGLRSCSRQLAKWFLLLVLVLGTWGYVHQAARFGLFPYQRGLWLEYYPDGKIKQQARYLHGVLDGEYREYFPTGRLSFEGSYREGQREGMFITHTPAGKHLSEVVYKDGQLSELTRYVFVANGMHTWLWRADEPNKKRHEFWNNNGHTTYKEIYVDGYLVSYRQNISGEFVEILCD